MRAARAATSAVTQRVLRIDRRAAPRGESATAEGDEDREGYRKGDDPVVDGEARELRETDGRERTDGPHADPRQRESQEEANAGHDEALAQHGPHELAA